MNHGKYVPVVRDFFSFVRASFGDPPRNLSVFASFLSPFIRDMSKLVGGICDDMMAFLFSAGVYIIP